MHGRVHDPNFSKAIFMKNLKHFSAGQYARQPSGFAAVTIFAIDDGDTGALWHQEGGSVCRIC